MIYKNDPSIINTIKVSILHIIFDIFEDLLY